MEDLARRVGVSIVTVHRTLHQPEKVSEETRRRVQRAIAETGYVQNLIAGSLASNRTNVIAALVPTLSNLAYGTTVHAMNEVLRKNGFHLLLGTVGFSAIEEQSLIVKFLGRRPDGMFLYECKHTPETRHLLQNAGIPIVETGDLPKYPLNMAVSYSSFEAGKAMTEYLLAKGYRRIAFVGVPSRENDRHFHRWRGYCAALRACEIAYNPARVLHLPLGFHQGAEALLALLDRNIGIDAVFFASDVFAAGAQLECLRRGWPIPEMVAIVGFGDQEFARELVPPLTTVSVPRHEIGRLAGRMLLDHLRGQPVKAKVVNVGFRIIERASA